MQPVGFPPVQPLPTGLLDQNLTEYGFRALYKPACISDRLVCGMLQEGDTGLLWISDNYRPGDW